MKEVAIPMKLTFYVVEDSEEGGSSRKYVNNGNTYPDKYFI